MRLRWKNISPDLSLFPDKCVVISEIKERICSLLTDIRCVTHISPASPTFSWGKETRKKKKTRDRSHERQQHKDVDCILDFSTDSLSGMEQVYADTKTKKANSIFSAVLASISSIRYTTALLSENQQHKCHSISVWVSLTRIDKRSVFDKQISIINEVIGKSFGKVFVRISFFDRSLTRYDHTRSLLADVQGRGWSRRQWVIWESNWLIIVPEQFLTPR